MNFFDRINEKFDEVLNFNEGGNFERQSERKVILDQVLKLAEKYESTKNVKLLGEINKLVQNKFKHVTEDEEDATKDSKKKVPRSKRTKTFEENPEESDTCENRDTVMKEVESIAEKTRNRVTRVTRTKQKVLVDETNLPEKQVFDEVAIKKEKLSDIKENSPPPKMSNGNIKIETDMPPPTTAPKRTRKKQTNDTTETKNTRITRTKKKELTIPEASVRESDVILEPSNVSIINLVDDDPAENSDKNKRSSRSTRSTRTKKKETVSTMPEVSVRESDVISKPSNVPIINDIDVDEKENVDKNERPSRPVRSTRTETRAKMKQSVQLSLSPSKNKKIQSLDEDEQQKSSKSKTVKAKAKESMQQSKISSINERVQDLDEHEQQKFSKNERVKAKSKKSVQESIIETEQALDEDEQKKSSKSKTAKALNKEDKQEKSCKSKPVQVLDQEDKQKKSSESKVKAVDNENKQEKTFRSKKMKVQDKEVTEQKSLMETADEKSDYLDALTEVEIPPPTNRPKLNETLDVVKTIMNVTQIINSDPVESHASEENKETRTNSSIVKNMDATIIKDINTETLANAAVVKNVEDTVTKDVNGKKLAIIDDLMTDDESDDMKESAEPEVKTRKNSNIPVRKPTYTTPQVPTRIIPSFASTSKMLGHTPSSSYDSNALTLSAMKASAKELRERELKRKQKQMEAQQKKEAYLQAQIEEKRKKREEKELKAKLVREEIEREKLKFKEAQQLKDLKVQQLIQEKLDKKQKIREELEKKRMLIKKAYQEKKQEEKLQEEELKIKAIKEKKKPIYLTEKAPLLPTYDCYDSDNPDIPENTTMERPPWTRSELLFQSLRCKEYIDDRLKNTLFCTRAQTLDLRTIFENVNPDLLKRNSSAVWHTVPRFTLMPGSEEI